MTPFSSTFLYMRIYQINLMSVWALKGALTIKMQSLLFLTLVSET